MQSITRLFAISSAIVTVLGATYSQTDSHTGSGFLNSFSYQAISIRLMAEYHFVLRADYKTVLDPNGPGRNSVRIQSNKQYTTGVMVFNVRHMPQGCGTWPAIWTVGANWPNGGEVDILEGVNDQGPDQVTLHTSSGCSMPGSRSQTGTALQNNCDVAANSNAGCGVRITDTRSYGSIFNNKGGGWFAVERTNSFIKVWFWSKEATDIPSDVLNGATSVNTDGWGTPRAYFPSTSCPISSKFSAHNIVINRGDWAGSVYGSSGCPSTCVDYVNNNPSAFKDAYFDLQWLKIYG
ncbi:endo-beta-glucanase [Cyathus striatus]|nr:endo-beta-glucanase [Cyathus striatus]